MSDRNDPPDYRNLLQSPYDPGPGREGPEEGASDLPWVPAVVAAAFGAILVGAFVVFAVATGPDAPEEVSSTTTTLGVAVAEQGSGPPPEFTAITDEVAAAVVGFADSDGGFVAAIATAVDGGADPAAVPPIDVAYWVLTEPGGEQLMRSQYSEKGAIGNITVEFPPGPTAEDRALVPYLAVGESVSESFVIEVGPTVPQTISGQRLELASGEVVVIDGLTIGDGWGWLDWSAEESVVAKVDTVVTFVGTDDPGTDDLDPTQLLSPHLVPLRQGTGVPPLAPLFSFTGSGSLARFAEPLSSSNAPTEITVEFRVTVPADIAQGPRVTLPAAG